MGHGEVKTAGTSAWSVALGWLAMGVLNALCVDVLEPPASGAWAVRIFHHAVDLGRHVGFGLLALALSYAGARYFGLDPAEGRGFRKRGAWLAMWLGSLGLGALLLPDDLTGAGERWAQDTPLPSMLVTWLFVVLVSSALPLVAWISLALARHVWGRAALLVLGGACYTANNTTSPYDNSGLHFFLCIATALLIAGALKGAGAFLAARVSAVRGQARVALFATSGVWALWAIWYPHRSAVLVDLSRWPGNLLVEELAQWNEPDGEDMQATLENPFFKDRSQAPDVPPTRALSVHAQPIVILLTVDGLRADVLAGEKTRTSMPTLARLAREGAWFTQARAPGTQTVVTLASLSTSTYFSQQRWTPKPPGKTQWPHQDKNAHLAQLLSAAGVATALVPAVVWMHEEYGLLRGFSRVEPKREAKGWASGETVTQGVLAALRAQREGPAFLYAHYLDTHAPYKRGGKVGDDFERYLKALTYVDRQIRRVLDEVRRLHLSERVYLVISSDHGEAFGEHATRYHATTLYEELLRVPLIVHGPGIAAQTIDEPVSLVDVAPTVLDLFGLSTPGRFMGQSLAPLLARRPFRFARPIVAETRLKQAIVFPDGIKVIVDQRRKTVEVYDLTRDPEEQDDLWEHSEEKVRPRVPLLRSFFQQHTLTEGGYKPPYRK